jgi:hypothetical protein
MREMLTAAGFVDVKIQVKENAADFIKDWMPGSGAEKFITSAYVTAVKPVGSKSILDNVRVNVHNSDVAVAVAVVPSSEPAASAGC